MEKQKQTRRKNVLKVECTFKTLNYEQTTNKYIEIINEQESIPGRPGMKWRKLRLNPRRSRHMGPFFSGVRIRSCRVLCPVAKRLRNPKRQDRGSHRNYYNRHTLRYKGHKYKQPKRPKRNSYWKKRDLFMFYRFAGIQPEDLEEDEERRTPHSATNSTGSPPK